MKCCEFREHTIFDGCGKKLLKEQSRIGGILLASFRPTIQKYSFKQSHVSFLSDITDSQIND